MSANETITTMSEALAADRPTLTVKEVANLLGVDVRTVYRAIEDEQLPALRIGKKRLVPRLKLMELLGADAA
ncbi:helix-turn-helix domain-containing protein [Pseudactinotalea sp. Z1739]|uniref:helix-turn-helix domain-containing protein n=1 Tax=Pseudactinotalea sp. Z1739 TaxID=3413028 RepID=UPI003C7B0F0A